MRYKSAARSAAVCAVMTALLIAVQYALGFVPGVELVTVFLLCFCVAYGAACGMLTATAFSLLRCILFGFYPNVAALYLVYFNAFALLFGMIGRREKPIAVWVCPLLLLPLAAGCAVGAALGLPVSVLYRARLSAMLWALFGVLAAVLALYLLLTAVRRGAAGREAAALAALAALCTVCFTLLDDVFTPLFYGYTPSAALAYFYTGFFAMVPQTLCAAVSVLCLYPPLVRVMRASRGAVLRGEKKPFVPRKRASNDGRTQKDVL